MLSGPADVIAPVNPDAPSTKSGSAPDPPVKDVAVAVVETAFTVIAGDPLSTTSSNVPDGLENCSPVAPSAALSCVTTDAGPPEKSTPTTVSFGFAVAAFDNGSADGASTPTMVILWGTLVPSLKETWLVFPLESPPTPAWNPPATTVPAVVVSES